MAKNRVFLKEGLIEEWPNGYALITNKCPECGRVYFPQRSFCLGCFSENLEPLRLSNHGTLYTFTIVNMPSEHYPPPYAIGWVEFPEGVRIFGQIKGYDAAKLQIGMKMNVVIDRLWEEPDKEIIGYKFEPASEQEKKCGK
jgi:uncharacterized protein